LAAIGKFAARPLAGWGAGSWATGLLGFLPTAGAVTPTTLVSLPGGAAHNAYLTVAAEKGLLGLLPAVVMTIFLGRVAVELWQMRDRLANADRTTALLAPAAVCALVLHSLLEQPGLFGYGDSIADFATLGMASLLIGLRSTLEPSPRLTMLSFE
jgi:O-antigen ligase